MRKIFAIFTALLLLSCSTNHDEVVVSVKQNPTTKITKEQALKNLYGELKIIDAETRAGGEARKVKSIKSLEGAKTRSGNALDNDLLYIVEFEEGQGSAVLAADNRLEPVIAVLDSDVMTAEDFASDDMDDIGVYMASGISAYAESALDIEAQSLIPITPKPSEIDTTYTQVLPLINTKWNQDAPYNNLCYDANGNQALAGCTVIATAQLIYYLKPNHTLTINGTNIDTGSLGSMQYGYTPTNTALETVAIFVSSIGHAVNANFGVSSTTASLQDAAILLTDLLGYQHVFRLYSEAVTCARLNSGAPIIMQGSDPIDGDCHAWIIDGYSRGDITQKKFNVSGGYETIHIGSFTKVHCNFGWGGKCDGYYADNIFNVNVRNYDLDSSVGDFAGTNGANFTTQFRMINTY